MGTAQERLERLLRRFDACSKAVNWVRDYDLPTLEDYWCACPNVEWLQWMWSTLRPVSPLALRCDPSCGDDCILLAPLELDGFLSVVPFASIEAALAARATEEKAP